MIFNLNNNYMLNTIKPQMFLEVFKDIAVIGT